MELIDLEFISLLMSRLFSLMNDKTKIPIKILNMLMLLLLLFFKYLVTFIIFDYCDLYNISIENL